MDQGKSDVVETMRQSKDEAWAAWWAQVNGPAKCDAKETERLWEAYERAAIVFCGEIEARERLGGFVRVTA
jgi:hypothetical protein